MKKILPQIALLISLCVAGVGAFAGGPLNLAGPAGRTPVTYPNGGQNINMNLDQGNLGSRTKIQADALFNQAFALWNNVPTSTVTLTRGPDLPVDVTAANFSTYLNRYNDGLNPVIYDTDGSITDSLFGVGAKNNILGFAGSAFVSSTATYAEGEAVINGFLSISNNTLTVVLAHEVGHFIGLDHTQLDNTQGLANSNFALMYPTAFRTLTSLHEDDTAAISALYPTGISAAYGTLTGVFTQVNAAPIRGANIWVRETTSARVYSSVSDFLTEGTGFYRMLLPPGIYTLNAESIQTNFTAGSSVGPYADNSSSASFLAPHPITPVVFQGATPGPASTFRVTAGCAANITFRLDGSGSVDSTTCLNRAPVAQNGTISTPANTPVNGIAGASDQDNDPLTYRVVSQGTRGTAIMNTSTGAFTYTPQVNASGSDSFTFAANDGTLDSNIAAIAVTILSNANIAPTISSLTATPQTLSDNATSQLQVTANDADNAPAGLSYTWSIATGGGGLSSTTITNPIYTPANVSVSTPVTINVVVSDGAASVNRSITLTVNDAVLPPPNADFVWIEDALPPGAVLHGDEPWNFISANPTPFSGGLAHQSAIRAGQHQHIFINALASSDLPINVGDVLFNDIYLDPANPPSEVMLQWYDGANAEHRAYWGANLINLGVDGTVSRRNMGPLPAAGQWVRLEIPASLVGMEGRVLKGMYFTLFNGRATWDRTGRTSAPAALALTTNTLASGTVGGTYGQTLAVTGGIAPYTWGVISGSPPAGLNLSSATGAISGTPSAPGVSNFTVQVRDNVGRTTNRALSLTISPPTGAGFPVAFDTGLSYSRELFVNVAAAPGGNGTQATPYNAIGTALARATPGTRIRVAAGTYGAIGRFSNLQGTPTAPIALVGEGEVIIDTGKTAQALNLVDPRYVVLQGITIQNAAPHGINIDDGGTYSTPAEYVVLRNMTFRNIGTGGNNDCLKLSGLDNFRIEGSSFSGCNQGEAIDMVGCHNGVISGNEFFDIPRNAVQTKGGSSDVLIHGNRFTNIAQRAINAGGSTGAAFYRPANTTHEAARIQIVANIIERAGNTSVAFVGCDTCVFANNTIIEPGSNVARILEENTTLAPGANGYFINNIIVLNTNGRGSVVNVGANTLPATYAFGSNLWFSLDNSAYAGPTLGGGIPAETGSLVQNNPLLDVNRRPQTGSPAFDAGRTVPRGLAGDFLRQTYDSPPAVGAFARP